MVTMVVPAVAGAEMVGGLFCFSCSRLAEAGVMDSVATVARVDLLRMARLFTRG